MRLTTGQALAGAGAAEVRVPASVWLLSCELRDEHLERVVQLLLAAHDCQGQHPDDPITPSTAHLHRMVLSKNKFTVSGVRALARLLAVHRDMPPPSHCFLAGLRLLHVGCETLDDAAAVVLAEACEGRGCTLQDVSLGGSCITDAGGLRWLRALTRNRSIQHLRLFRNALTDAFVLELAELMPSFSFALQGIHLHGNVRITALHRYRIVAALPSCNVSVLDVGGCSMSPAAVQDIKAACAEPKRLWQPAVLATLLELHRGRKGHSLHTPLSRFSAQPNFDMNLVPLLLEFVAPQPFSRRWAQRRA